MRQGHKLVLFDIDGTIMSTGGVGREAFRQAVEAVHGPLPQAEGWRFAGKTDPQICRELLEEAGLEAAAIAEMAPRVIAHYLDGLEAGLPGAEGCHLKPGVREVIAALEADPDVVLGLLTGNVERGARIKIAHFGLWTPFVMGAFGSDHAERPALPAIAVERARALTGTHFRGKDIVIIGDTEHDVACGEALGVRTVAVATGPFAVDELVAFGADHAFADMADTERVLAAIRG